MIKTKILRDEFEFLKYKQELEERIKERRGIKPKYHAGEPESYPVIVISELNKKINKITLKQLYYIKHLFVSYRIAKKLCKLNKSLAA